MASDNFVQIVGNVTRDPELRFTTGGTAVCSFGVAWTPHRRNSQTGEWEDGDTSFFNCSAWRDLGENIAASSIDRTDAYVVQLWLDSSGHCALIMDPDFSHAGIGVGRDPENGYDFHHFWTLDFGG